MTLFQVFSKLLYPIVRGAALSVLKYMLLTFQHSHEAFHLVRAPACCSEDVQPCFPHWSGWRPGMLSMLVVEA